MTAAAGHQPDPAPSPPSGAAAPAAIADVVIVNHNTRDDLLACLASLRGSGARRVVVADAGSRDDSLEAAAAQYPEVQALALPNLGFGRAANIGIAATDAPVVVVANADTRFPAHSVTALAEHVVGAPSVGCVGPLVRFPDGRIQMSARAFPLLGDAIGHAVFGLWRPGNRWTRRYRLTDWDHASDRDVDWVSGCCVALRREAFDAVGGFDPAYFMFVEDVDLCWRLKEAGWRVRFSAAVEVIHAIGGAVGPRRLAMTVEHARSLDRFLERRYDALWQRPLRPLLRLGLVGWVALAVLWQLVCGRGRSHAHG